MDKKIENQSLPEWKPSIDDVNRLQEEIHKPRYPFGVLEDIDDKLTYRRLNYWEKVGLISPFRKTDKTGWRKFSFYQAVQLLMINDLKQVGLTAKTIRKVLFKLTSNQLGIPWLEIFLVSSVRGGRYVFLIDKTGEITTPMKDEAILDELRPDNIDGPSVVCPLYYYVRRLLNLIRPEKSSSALSEPRDLNEKD